MYTPASFKASDSDANAIIDNAPFAILISVSDGAPLMTHVPLLRDGDTLFGHMARANPHSLLLNGPVTAVFQGPHTYISPRWYINKDVPTWNYSAAHVSGDCRTVDDNDRQQELMNALVKRFESGAWSVEWDNARYTRMMTAVTFFEITIRHITATMKLSQNKSTDEIVSVIDALSASGQSADSQVADAMKRLKR